MMNTRRNTGRFTKDRRGARKMAPVKAMSQKEAIGTTIPLRKYGSKIKLRLVAKKQKDTSHLDESSEFDRRLVQKCRNDGMTDSEIQKWMQEI